MSKLFTALVLAGALSFAQAVTVVHNDSNQSGANTAETHLTPANVATKFGKLCSASITGNSYAQPLYMPGLSIAGGTHDTMIVTTMANNVYAIDRVTCVILWTRNLGSPWTNYGNCCSGNEIFYGAPMGILGTGVIDPVALKFYVVNATTTPSHVLNRINLLTGAVEASVTIAGSVPGTGQPGGDSCASGGILTFCSTANMQVTGLILSPDASKVYIGFGGWENGSQGEHGWLIAYSTAGSMPQAGIFCTTPNGYLASPWMSRGAPSIDASGNVYIVTGNGDSNASVGSYGEYVLKFSPTLSLTGTFQNPNWSNDNTVDADFGSNRFLLIPGTSVGVAAGKDFSVYPLNLSTMAASQASFKSNSGGTPAAFTGSFGGMYMNGMLFLPTTTGPIYAFFYVTQFNVNPSFTTSASLASHNGQMSGSANGASNGIIWQVTSATSSFVANPQGTLRALNAATGVEIWNSGSTLGLLSKFAAPTVADGTVMVVTNSGTLVTFGILPAATLRGTATMRGNAVIR